MRTTTAFRTAELQVYRRRHSRRRCRRPCWIPRAIVIVVVVVIVAAVVFTAVSNPPVQLPRSYPRPDTTFYTFPPLPTTAVSRQPPCSLGPRPARQHQGIQSLRTTVVRKIHEALHITRTRHHSCRPPTRTRISVQQRTTKLQIWVYGINHTANNTISKRPKPLFTEWKYLNRCNVLIFFFKHFQVQICTYYFLYPSINILRFVQESHTCINTIYTYNRVCNRIH